jgi:hypothetical protein
MRILARDGDSTASEDEDDINVVGPIVRGDSLN